MSNQVYASQEDPLYLSTRGNDKIMFNKQSSPPLAFLDKGLLYELDDGVLYFNGSPISGGGSSGDVNSSISSCQDNAAVRFDSTTGKLIQDSSLIIDDSAGDSVELSGRIGSQTLPLLLATDSSQKTALGLRTPDITDLGIDSTAIGYSSMSNTLGAPRCTAVGSESLLQCNGANNTCLGYQSGFNYTGIEANNVCIDSPGVLGDNQTIRIGDTQTKCFVKGVYAAGAIGASQAVIVDAAGQLSSQAFPATGLVLGATVDSGVILVNGGTPGEINGSRMSWDTTGSQFLLNEASYGTVLKSVANESLYMGVAAGNSYSGISNCVFGNSAMAQHSGGSSNTAFGSFCLNAKTTASGNTCIGANAASNLTTGGSNVVIGQSAGSAYTSSESNNIIISNTGVIGDNATIRIGSATQTQLYVANELKSLSGTLCLGNQAGTSITSATSRCTLLGSQTGINLVAQTDNTFAGYFAGRYATGSTNTIFGANTASGTSFTGTNNLIAGVNTGLALTTGSQHCLLGTNVAPLLTTGTANMCLGNVCAPNLSTGGANILISGCGATVSTLTTGSNNIIIGANAATATEATTIRIGSSTHTNTTIGVDFRSNNTLTRVGFQAANAATTATNTVAVGSLALGAITTQGSNTAVGYQAGQGTTGQFNAIFGTSAMPTAGLSNNNSVFGSNSAPLITSGANNCVFGQGALPVGTTCSDIIAIGRNSGGVQATGSNCIYLAANAGVATEANTIRIGTGGGTHTRAFVAGVSGVTTGGAAVACLVDANGQLGTVSSSKLVKENIRDVEDTSFLYKLGIKNFEYITQETDKNGNKQKQVGVIAEDVELIKPELVIMQGNGIKTVDYNYLFICALKEIQNLKNRLDILESQ